MDLSTRYLGLELRSPLVASAGPLTSTADGVRRLAESGVGAVVLAVRRAAHARGEPGFVAGRRRRGLLPRGAQLPPRCRVRALAASVPAPDLPGGGGGRSRRAGDRVAERCHARRLD